VSHMSLVAWCLIGQNETSNLRQDRRSPTVRRRELGRPPPLCAAMNPANERLHVERKKREEAEAFLGLISHSAVYCSSESSDSSDDDDDDEPRNGQLSIIHVRRGASNVSLPVWN
jgi:hypothetical protein